MNSKGSKIGALVGKILSHLHFRKPPPESKATIYINIAVGIAIAIFFHWAEETEWGELQLNRVFDLFIRYEATKSAERDDSKIVFVDFGKTAYEKWNRPSITPRDEIARLIDDAYKGGAAVIVPDFLFEEPDCFRKGGDRRLEDLLRKIGQDGKNAMKDPTKPFPKIVLPTQVGYDQKMRKTLFDQFINGVNIFHGLPYVSSPSNDLTVRYWVTYDVARNSRGEKVVLWGMPLLAAVLAEGNIDELKEIEKNVIKKDEKETYGVTLRTLPEGKKITFPSRRNREDLYLQRIRYFLIPPPAPTGDEKEGNGPPDIRPNLLNELIMASELTENAGTKKERLADLFKGKIVIIGNSIPDVGDIHLTPVGRMAGMYIIGNSLYTMMRGLQITRPPLWAVYLMESAVIAIAAYLFVAYASLPAQFLSSILLAAVFGPLSLYLYMKTGVFLNFLLSIWGMSIHRMVTNIEEIFESSHPGGEGKKARGVKGIRSKE
jgi:CHASE2 domain-containing sensor protein